MLHSTYAVPRWFSTILATVLRVKVCMKEWCNVKKLYAIITPNAHEKI